MQSYTFFSFYKEFCRKNSGSEFVFFTYTLFAKFALTTLNTPKTPVFARITQKRTILGHSVSQKSCTRSTGGTRPSPSPSLKGRAKKSTCFCS